MFETELFIQQNEGDKKKNPFLTSTQQTLADIWCSEMSYPASPSPSPPKEKSDIFIFCGLLKMKSLRMRSASNKRKKVLLMQWPAECGEPANLQSEAH